MSHRNYLVVTALLACACFITPCFAASTAPASQPAFDVLQDRPDRLIVALPNGLIIVAQEIHAAPVVSVQAWVKTGSIYEQEHVGAGLSHFLEHLLSGGTTTTRPERQTNIMLGQIGAHTNASTSLDNVRYYINTAAPHASTAIELMSDWMQNSLITQAEYERERTVIQREFDMGNGEPARVFWKLTNQVRYRHHPARHPTIGYIDEYMKVTRDQIYDFYKRMYVPNNIVFVVAGDIDARKTVKQVAGLWKNAKPGKLPAVSLPIEGAPSVRDRKREVQGTASVTRPRVRFAWPGTRVAGEHDFALDLLATILGQGESSRLVKTVRDQERAAFTISAFNLSYNWGEGFFGIDADVAPAKPEAMQKNLSEPPSETDIGLQILRKLVLLQIALVVEKGVTEAELARAKRQVLAHTVFAAEGVEDQANRLVNDLIGMGDPDYMERYAEAVQRIKASELQAAAKALLTEDRLITVLLRPAPKGQPFEPFVRPAEEPGDFSGQPIDLDNRALVARIKAANVAAKPAPPLALDPIKLAVLPNGMRVLVQRNTLVPSVAIQLYYPGGLLIDAPGKEGVANATATMLMRGTTTRSAEKIALEIEDLGAMLGVQCGNNTLYARAQCLSQDWRTVMDLLADVTINPTFPAAEWDKLRPRLMAAIERQRETWNGELGTRFREQWYAKHPWSQLPTGRADVVFGLKVEDMVKFHREEMIAGRAVLTIFGDVDPDEALKQASAAFGKMPRGDDQPRIIPTPMPPKSQVLVTNTDKPLAAVMVGLGPVGSRTSPDYATLQVLTRVLSTFPSGWLEDELRGRGPGLVYAVGAAQNTGMVPGHFGMIFNTKPASVPEALYRAMAVVERAKTTLIDDETLARAKASVLTDEFFSKQSNSDRAMEAALAQIYGLPLDESKRFLMRVEAVNAATLKTAANRYFVNPLVVVITNEALDENDLKRAMELKQPKGPAATQAGKE